MTGDDELGDSAKNLLAEIFAELDKRNGEVEGWLVPDDSTSQVAKEELEDCGYIELDRHRFSLRPTIEAVRAWRREKKEPTASLSEVPTGTDPRREHLKAAEHVFQQLAARYRQRFEVRDTLQAKRLGAGALRACLDTLARRGLVSEQRNSFIISDLGVAVAMGEADLGQELGLEPRPNPVVSPTGIYIESLGALNTGAGGTAIGSVTITADAGMRRLLDLESQLKEDREELWKILLRVKQVELKQEGMDGLEKAVEELQIREFVQDLRGEKQKLVVEVLRGASPALVGLLGDLATG